MDCDHHERFSVYAKNHETIGLGSILFLVCAFFHVDLHRPSRYTTHLWHNRQHLKPTIRVPIK
jgi:hypothetical protein